MAIRDRLRGVARVAATAAGDALLGWAEDSSLGFARAEVDPTAENDDQDQDKAPGGDDQDTAQSAPVPDVEATEDPKSLFWDAYSIVEQLGYKERASSITYGTLKAMAWKMPIVHAIIQTRVNQVASFAVPQRDKYALGYRIKLRDSEQTPTPEDKKWIKQAELLLQRTGITDNPRSRDSFEKFLRKIAFDTLVYDQMTFETVPNKLGQPAEWYAVDAATIRLADSVSTYRTKTNDADSKFVQIYDGMIVNEYTQEELCFGVRNPRTDIKLAGYGVSELEMLVGTITSLLWAWEYNKKAFSQGSVHKGVLNFKGAIPEKQLRAFRRHWYQMLSGVENAWRTPIVNSEGLEWLNMHSNNREMEYNAWMDFLIKVACSMYAMDPLEVNFKYGNAGQKSGLQEASNKEKITESKERGLRPLLRFIADCINTHIIWPWNESFEFQFVGLDAATRDDVAKLNSQRVKTTHTVNELRAEEDLEPIEDGDVILDPAWMQAKGQKDMMAQGGGEGGFPGAEGGDEGGGGFDPDADDEDDDEADFLAQFADLEDDDDDENEDEAEKSFRKSWGPRNQVVIDVEL